MNIIKFHMRAFATLLGAALITGCAGSGHVGESWQCPLAQGTACQSVAEADPAARAPGESRETTLPAPVHDAASAGYSVLGGILSWFVEIFSGEDEAEVATAEPLIVSPAAEDAPYSPHENLRTKERIARIWIAPYVDPGGVYREGGWVRVVVRPAGWRLP